MSSTLLHRLLATALLFVVPTSFEGQAQRRVITDIGDALDTPVPHPLSWWTRNPLRLDASGELRFDKSASDGRLITARGYRVKQSVTHLGTLSGHRVVQVLTNIYADQRVIALFSSNDDMPPTQWKSLLVQVGTTNQYVAIYELQAGSGLFQTLPSAAIYGAGQDAILGTYDPASGNGGGCRDGYWWFDKSGAHVMDFSPLEQAIHRALPPNSTYTPSCWALHPEKAELQSEVRRVDAECHACGRLGQIVAKYRIQQGAALPVSVHFEPGSEH